MLIKLLLSEWWLRISCLLRIKHPNSICRSIVDTLTNRLRKCIENRMCFCTSEKAAFPLTTLIFFLLPHVALLVLDNGFFI